MINIIKKFSAASLTEALRKNKLRVAVYSLLMILITSFSILSCDEGIKDLETKWRSLYGVDRLWKDATKAMAEGQPHDLRRYDIKINLKRVPWRMVKIRFCDKYGFFLAGEYIPSGVYYKKGESEKKYVSTAKYPSSPLLRAMAERQPTVARRRTAAQRRLEDFHLRLRCDLVEKKVLVYIDGKLIEEVPLGSGPLKYSFGLGIPPGRKWAMLDELKISDPKGRVLCDVNFVPLIFYKRISQVFLFLGALTLGALSFSLLVCFGGPLLRKALFLVRSMLFAIGLFCNRLKSSAASLTEIIRKNKSRSLIYSLLMILIASFSILSCDEGIKDLETKWRSLYGVDRLWKDATKAMAEGQPHDLRRYDIKINLKRVPWRMVKIRFCDKYGFFLAGEYIPSGVYYRKGESEKKYVSTAKYPSSHLPHVMAERQRTAAQQPAVVRQRTAAQQPAVGRRRMAAQQSAVARRRTAAQRRLEDFHLRLRCDLVEKKVLVYIDGKLIEEVPLGSGPLKYSFGLGIPPGRKWAMLDELKISDPKGRVLCDVNFVPLIFYKRISQVFLFLGALTLGALSFSLLVCFAGFLFRKALLFVRSMLFPILLLVMMVTAIFSIRWCEKEIWGLEKKWRALYELKGMRGYEGPEGMAGGRPHDLTQYDIKVDLTQFDRLRAEIRFCDKYSFILYGSDRPSGVYYKAREGQEKYISTAEYPFSPQPVTTAQKLRGEGFRLHLKCDLTGRTVLVYINGKFREKIPLGPDPLKYLVGLDFLWGAGKETILNKLEISAPKGRVLCDIDFTPLFFHERVSQALFILGALVFLVLACSEKLFFRKTFLFMALLVSLEAFLRIGYSHTPNLLNIKAVTPEWRFETATNFYGGFNDPKYLTVRSYYNFGTKKYRIANPEHAMRILCFGSSPVEGFTLLPGQQAFPALLERKINPSNKMKNRIIPLTMVLNSEDIIGPLGSTFIYEVASRLNPDLLLIYGVIPSMGGEDSLQNKKLLTEECILYDKAKKLIEKNSDWIKNDRLLYAALEFKHPVKEIVYLYDFLCNSYLFMAVENIRKKVLNQWSSAYGDHFSDQELLAEKPGSFFEKVLKWCGEKKITVVFIPKLEFSTPSHLRTPEERANIIRKKYPEVYFLDLKNVLSEREDFLLGNDPTHPSGYGQQVIAEELFRQLTEKGLLKISTRR